MGGEPASLVSDVGGHFNGQDATELRSASMIARFASSTLVTNGSSASEVGGFIQRPLENLSEAHRQAHETFCPFYISNLKCPDWLGF